MPETKPCYFPIFLIFLLLQTGFNCYAQTDKLNAAKWADELGRKEYNDDEIFTNHILLLRTTDSRTALQFLDDVEKRGDATSYYFVARFNCLKGRVIYLFPPPNYPEVREKIKEQEIDLHKKALDVAYRSEDDALIAFVSHSFAEILQKFNETGRSFMYFKNAIDLYEKIHHPVTPYQYQAFAELLYKVSEYGESITYAKKAIIGWKASTEKGKDGNILTCTNTIALDYHRQQKYDSAMAFYHEALQLAGRLRDTVWIGIVSGNMGQISYAQGNYEQAYTWLIQDYQSSMQYGEEGNAANSLQWAARASLAMGNKSQALMETKEAIRLLKTAPESNFLRNSYYALTQIYRKLGMYDSAFFYNDLYSRLNDSLEKVVLTNSLAISSARLNDERSRYQIQNLNSEKRSEIMWRNFIIAFIVLLSLLIFVVINRKLLKTRTKMDKAEQEIISAKEQLQMFTSHLIEKTDLVEKLQLQASSKKLSLERQALISEINQSTILTEADWLKFKSLFEKIYPTFLSGLKEKVPEITAAELRMAALTRLRLSTNQIASMLGISPNSVYKTKQRLRQRLNLDGDISLEDSFA